MPDHYQNTKAESSTLRAQRSVPLWTTTIQPSPLAPLHAMAQLLVNLLCFVFLPVCLSLTSYIPAPPRGLLLNDFFEPPPSKWYRVQ